MKSDKIADAIVGIDDDLIEGADKKTANNNKSIWFKWGSVAAAFIIVAGGVFAFSGMPGKKGAETKAPSFAEQTETVAAAYFSGTTDKAGNSQRETLSDEELHPAELDTDYVFNGKTIAQYREEYDNAWLLAYKCETLLKEGDALKYGEALYLTGTPDGEKWDKGYYTERLELYGELLDKYISDGEFLKDELQKDLADAYAKRDEAMKACDTAVKAFYTENGIDINAASDEEVITAENASA